MSKYVHKSLQKEELSDYFGNENCSFSYLGPLVDIQLSAKLVH